MDTKFGERLAQIKPFMPITCYQCQVSGQCFALDIYYTCAHCGFRMKLRAYSAEEDDLDTVCDVLEWLESDETLKAALQTRKRIIQATIRERARLQKELIEANRQSDIVLDTIHEATNFRELLKSKPLNEWVVNYIVTLGWYDGTYYGVCEMSDPALGFEFSQFALRGPRGRERRLFDICELPLPVVREIKKMQDEDPSDSSWILDDRIDSLLSASCETGVIFESPGEGVFSEWWEKSTS